MISFSPQNLSVSFLGCSKDLLEITYFITRIRQSDENPFALWHSIQLGEIKRSTMQESDKKVKKGPLQYGLFLFLVNNISIGCYQNILRDYITEEDIGLFQNKSSKSNENHFITPPEFLTNKAVTEKWKKLQQEITEFAGYCSKKGISLKDTGLLQPMAALSKDILAFDFKTLQNFLENKMCEKTPWEAKKLAWQIYEAMKEEFPILAQRLGIKCWENRQMFCDESSADYKKCRFGNGFSPHKSDLENIWLSETQIQEFEKSLPV